MLSSTDVLRNTDNTLTSVPKQTALNFSHRELVPVRFWFRLPRFDESGSSHGCSPEERLKDFFLYRANETGVAGSRGLWPAHLGFMVYGFRDRKLTSLRAASFGTAQLTTALNSGIGYRPRKR